MRENKILCPHCLKGIVLDVKIEDTREAVIEAFQYNTKTKEWWSPRGKFTVEVAKLQERVKFLLDNWAEKVKVYDKNGKVVKTFRR